MPRLTCETMGIIGLFPFLQKKAPRSISEVSIDAFADSKWALDGNALLYKFMYSVQNENLSHLTAKMLKFATFLKSKSIIPIFVFDGDAPDTKIVLEDRRKRRREAHEECDLLKKRLKTIESQLAFQVQPAEPVEPVEPVEPTQPAEPVEPVEPTQPAEPVEPVEPTQLESGDEPGTPQTTTELLGDFMSLHVRLRTKEKQTIKITREQTDHVRDALREKGFHAHTAKGEGDALLIAFALLELVDGIVADDGDMLAGMPENCKLIRNITKCQYDSTEKLKIYSKGMILEELELNFDEFIEMCVLFGCDYLKRIPKVGNMTAFKGIKKHGSVGAFLQNGVFKSGNLLPEGWTVDTCQQYITTFPVAKEQFRLDPLFDKSDYPELLPGPPQYEEEREELSDDHSPSLSPSLSPSFSPSLSPLL